MSLDKLCTDMINTIGATIGLSLNLLPRRPIGPPFTDRSIFVGENEKVSCCDLCFFLKSERESRDFEAPLFWTPSSGT
jgi:hypothetical protein